MIVVIIAGGAGTRLWPLSTPAFPKHLLAINGGDKSLLQNTYERAKLLGEHVYVITEASHAHLIQEQLSELDSTHCIIEPARRNTASCIVAGLHEIAKQHDPHEPIAFLHADHYVRDLVGFRHSFEVAATLTKRQKRIVLIGAEPYYPATGFGYIEKGPLFDDKLFAYEVAAFCEKPLYEKAVTYVKKGAYLWNCGYFVASLNTFLSSMKTYAPLLAKEYALLATTQTEAEYKRTYLGFERVAIDYALIEKVKDLLVVPASFDWIDLGSYTDLHRVAIRSEVGNYIEGNVTTDELQNSYIRNTEAKPVVVIGLDNVVIINTPDGVLVTRKDLSQKVGEVSKRLKYLS
jgi:mannose-1-phosphate guanylyltransferase/mannose-6-phosphate isomerase